jgi:hypothetical protein
VSVALALSVPVFVHAQVQRGTGSSNGQSGGVTAGTISTLNYYSLPPVTDQERAIALERLNLTLTELAIYRERPSELGEMSLLETIRTERIARRLYLVLSSFFDPTIAQAKNGKELLAFKRRYNLFVRSELILEQRSLEYIGQRGAIHFSEAWDPLLRFMILRTYRGSKEAVQSSGLQLLDTNWDQAETLYGQFITDQAGGAWLPLHAQDLERLIGMANNVLEPFQDQ